MKIRKLYLDMDGVLADFDRGIREYCGMEPVRQNARRSPGEDDRMWEKAGEVEHFYDRLELMPGAKEMFDEIRAAYGSRCEILSGIPRPERGMPTAAEDKRAWARRMLSEDIAVHTVLRAEKPSFCSGRDCVLIDDLEKNIRAWEACGGTGILHTDPESTLKRLSELEH